MGLRIKSEGRNVEAYSSRSSGLTRGPMVLPHLDPTPTSPLLPTPPPPNVTTGDIRRV
ncbi:hypothetical protein OCEANICA350_11525 [Oceanicaulis sp. 350]|nr:hypothetical protein OCEANICA350_11525 [Oceanicaulis sp. 350]